MTLCPVARLTFTVAEPEAKEPVTALLVAVIGSPLDGMTVTLIVVPTGIFVVARLIVTGLAWLAGRPTSATAPNAPAGGFAGVTPATETTLIPGNCEATTGLGIE